MEQNSMDDYAGQNNDVGGSVSGGGGVGIGVNHTNTAVALPIMGNNANADTNYEFQTMKPASGGVALPSYNSALTTVATNVTTTGTKMSNTNSNSRTEISHGELVKMLCYLEGELQARDVVIAALRSERVKQFITQLRTPRVELNDPYAAIFRDKITVGGSLISRESSTQAAQAEMEVRQIIEQQMEQQYQMVSKQRATHMRMVSILTESLENNQRMLQELEVEKRKHEHKGTTGGDGTATGGDNSNDVTYSLEMERNKLKQELEEERAQVKKLEKDFKELQKTLEYERNRQKQIVLLLIAERKKILMKYIEEGKRSEDLAQILAEEKQRSDTIADGLEEESKKSLRMEEEVEKQSASFEMERKAFKLNLAKEEKRVKDLEDQLHLLQNENELLKKQQLAAVTNATVATTTGGVISSVAGSKTNALNNDSVCVTPTVNIAKIVQPTATVSSVPVSGPTTGIARSITATQGVVARSGVVTGIATAATAHALNSAAIDGGGSGGISSTPSALISGLIQGVASAVSSSTSPSVQPPPLSPLPIKMQPTATIQRAPGGKFAAMSAAAGVHSLDQPAPHPVPIAVPPVTVPIATPPPQTGARGVPPPIPPNKPIVPPKREPSLSRLGSFSSGVGAATAAGSTNVGAAAGAVNSISVAAASSGAGAAAAAGAKNN